MAFSLKIEFYTDDDKNPQFVVEPLWWSMAALMSRYSFTP
jgi:hypothetical protein